MVGRIKNGSVRAWGGRAIASMEPTSPGEWDQAWLGCPYATYFQSREWSEIWAESTKGAFEPAAKTVVFGDGGTVVLPVTRQAILRGSGSTFLWSPAGTYGGWLANWRLSNDHVRLLSAAIERLFPSLWWRLSPYDPYAPQLAVKASSWDETYRFSLSGNKDALRDRLSKAHRTAVNHARNQGIVVRRGKTLQDWRLYYRVYQDCLERWGSTASSNYPWSLFEQMYARRSSHIDLWVATVDERIVAGAINFSGPAAVVGWHECTLGSHVRDRPVDLLLEHGIEDAQDRGFAWFDLNPSGGHEGVAQFKRGLGGAPAPAPVIHSSRGAAARVSQAIRMIRRSASRRESIRTVVTRFLA